MGSSAPTTEAGVMRATASSKAKIVEQSEKSLVPKTRPTSVMGEKEVAVPGKRKREALVDVTEVNKKKAILSKGKAKAVDASTITTTTTSIATTSTSTTASSRKALRPIAEAPTRRVFGVLTKGTAKPEDKVEILRTAGAARRALQVLRDDTLATDSEPGPKVFSPPEELESTTPAHETLVDEENVAAHLSKVEDEEEIPHDDLDINDWDDPTMCAEYANEIFDYMKSVEVNIFSLIKLYYLTRCFQPRTLPKAGYMDIQPELTWEMREQVFDWLIQVHYRFRFREESLFLCYNLLDRVLDLRQHVSKAKLQLVAVSCFLIATKFEEGVTPSIHDMATLVGDAYTVEEIQKAERYVLQTVGWDLSYPGPMGFLRRGSKADFYDPHSRTIAKYLLEVGYFDYHLVGTPPSQLAAASLWLARLAMGREDWVSTSCRC